jgi:hypothetical protein
MGAEQVDDLVAKGVEPVAATLPRVELNEILPVVGLTDSSLLAELSIDDPDPASADGRFHFSN